MATLWEQNNWEKDVHPKLIKYLIHYHNKTIKQYHKRMQFNFEIQFRFTIDRKWLMFNVCYYNKVFIMFSALSQKRQRFVLFDHQIGQKSAFELTEI